MTNPNETLPVWPAIVSEQGTKVIIVGLPGVFPREILDIEKPNGERWLLHLKGPQEQPQLQLMKHGSLFDVK